MSATPQTVSDFAKLAREAILAGNLDEAETYTNQAKALKSVDALTPTVDTSKRLDFGDPVMETPVDTATDIATKSWYMRQYGDSGTAMDQVMTELYGQDHRKFAWAKSADFVRYLRTGKYDDRMHRALVYSPTQVEGFLQLGMSVAELKATQIESQDTLGRPTPAA